MFDLSQFTDLLNKNDEFVSSGHYFDGSVQLNIGDEIVWIKIFMGRVILATETPPPFGYTFAIKGSRKAWQFACDEKKNRFREAVFTRRLVVEGNILEYCRMSKMVNGIMETLRTVAGPQGI
jgi:hypothetical protein